MGCLCSAEYANNSKIDNARDNWNREEQLTRKLLLLGTGASGKSTIFKQVKSLHGDGIAQNDKEESACVIRQNCVSGVIIILRKAHQLFEEDPQKYEKCKINIEDEKIVASITVLLQYSNCQFIEKLPDNEMQKLAEILSFLWALPCIQATYQIRGNKFAFPENMEFFFGKVFEVMNNNYFPTEEDVIKTRIRTTGLIEYRFELSNQVFYICDVGGQRNERRKWIHSFSDVTAVIFVSALNHYNALLFEDETKNSMHESIELFEELYNSKWFRNAEIILFLNKDDLFREQLKEEIPLSVCFSEEAKWRPSGPFWEGTNYHKKEDQKEDEKHFEDCYIEARDFITSVYTNGRDKHIYVHTTSATDRDGVHKIFWDVQNMIIRLNLDRGGLITN